MELVYGLKVEHKHAYYVRQVADLLYSFAPKQADPDVRIRQELAKIALQAIKAAEQVKV